VTDAPTRKVTNSPTFLLGYAPLTGLLAGFNYASASTVAANYPNEWEVFGRLRLLSEGRLPVSASVQAGYNEAARSVDGAVDVSRSLGPLRALGTVRVFSDAFGGSSAVAAGGGAVLTLGPVALAGDYTRLLDWSQDAAWGAALQWRIPHTPHTLSLHATNARTGTLQGASRGEGSTAYGFEFTVPITLARYFGGGGADAAAVTDAAAVADAPAVAGAGGVVTIVIKNLAYGQARVEVAPGTKVRWVNEDPVEHTVTAVNRRFDSGMIKPGGGVYERTFTEPGEYAYSCTPHPFMKAVVVVKAGTGSGT
jgi:plastocyanin